MHTKNWILTSYLNDVPYGTVGGQTAYGVEAAAQMFFDKPVWKLTLAQAALLAGLPQAPSEYNPFIDKGAALAPSRRGAAGDGRRPATSPRRRPTQANREPLQLKGDNAYSVRREPYVFDFIEQQVASRPVPEDPQQLRDAQQGRAEDLHDDRSAQAGDRRAGDRQQLRATRAEQGGPGVGRRRSRERRHPERPHRRDRDLWRATTRRSSITPRRPTGSRARRSRCSP